MANVLQVFLDRKLNCSQMASKTLQSINDTTQGAYCPAIWDELLCWPPTKAGTELQLPCPEYYGFKSEVSNY